MVKRSDRFERDRENGTKGQIRHPTDGTFIVIIFVIIHCYATKRKSITKDAPYIK